MHKQKSQATANNPPSHFKKYLTIIVFLIFIFSVFSGRVNSQQPLATNLSSIDEIDELINSADSKENQSLSSLKFPATDGNTLALLTVNKIPKLVYVRDRHLNNQERTIFAMSCGEGKEINITAILFETRDWGFLPESSYSVRLGRSDEAASEIFPVEIVRRLTGSAADGAVREDIHIRGTISAESPYFDALRQSRDSLTMTLLQDGGFATPYLTLSIPNFDARLQTH